VELSGLALFFYNTGNWLGTVGVPIFVIGLLGFVAYILYQIYRMKKNTINPTRIFFKNRDLVSECEFASAMSICISGGITVEESLSLSKDTIESEAFIKKIDKCSELTLSGMAFFEALDDAGIFNRRIVRRIQIAEKTAELDTTLISIADDLQNEIDYFVERRMARFEPLLIGILSGISSLILFSVMLPLMSIMSTL
jgi:type IV pilus assembly protein PilC